MVAWDWNLATGTVHRSEQAAEILGLESGTADDFLGLIHSEDRDRVDAAFAAAKRGEGDLREEFRVVLATGQTRWVSAVARLRIDPETHHPHLAGVCRDLTDRKQAELQIQASEQRFRQMANTAPVVIWVTDVSGYCTFINEHWARLVGQSVEQALGFGWLERIHPEDRELAKSQFVAATERKSDLQLEYRFLDHANNYRWAIAAGRPRFNRDGTFDAYIGCVVDITEHRLLEERLRQSQKMEAFGQLAGGVAHDFNNLLTIITGNSESLAEQFPSDDARLEFVREICAAGQRAASLTQQLLAFSRQTILASKVLDLNTVVSDIERMLRRLIGEDIRLRLRQEPNLRLIKLDPGQCEQILMNLIVNARDAMPRGGEVEIETSNVSLDERRAASHPEAIAGDYVRLTVRDTGCGMTPEVRARLFEPYFTTKAVGKGTGLGMAVVHGIVKQNGGYIDVSSEPGAGAVIQLHFPAVEGTAAAPKNEASGKPAPGSESLLLVEDEDAVRRLLLRILEQQGYQVLVASNGREALALLAEHREPIELLVTDVVMPELGGPELAHVLCPRYPEMKVLFLSGHTDDAMVRHGLVQDEVAFLQKPFSPLALVRKVREVLDATD
ncbi:hybrid sensor histidine kinase/response regulator [Candidatus Laterigemmans baculatus]|uniref:hybrid sensor histidine kinase/response regulator n=1 Tax=Candidatus Laterigemmans baculatus TaxID=2770505 RepID=UPI0013DB7BCA|nr:PAS domain-containing sensor histidine kinase [Candidatus Laterigemmans baculatus]